MSRAEDIVNRVNWKEHALALADAITPHHIRLLELAWKEQQKKFPLIGDFNLKNPRVADTIKTLGKRIVGIAETTRNDIRGILETALTGEGQIPSTDAIAKLIRESGANVSVSRAQTIARTETTTAFNHGAIASYAEAGVEKVELLDSDNDPECAERNGKIVSLEDALEIEPHPNCVLAFAPVVD